MEYKYLTLEKRYQIQAYKEAGNISDKVVNAYLEHHKNPSNEETNPMILG